MKILCTFLLIPFLMNTAVIFDFKKDSNLENWYVLDDTVMGGRSNGNLKLNDKGNAEFYGLVSLENYGGFSSIRHELDLSDISDYKFIKIKLKGDGKKYQFRVKSNSNDRHSYIHSFETNGAWESTYIELKDMVPSFRGRQLNMPNYPRLKLQEIAILIGNKKNESFLLEIDHISLEKSLEKL